MAKSDKDLQDIVGDAMGNDLLGTPKKKTPKTSTYSYPSGGSTYGSRRTYGRQSYLWEDDDQFGDEFEDDLRQSPFGGRRTTSEDLPEIWNDHAVIFDEKRMAALERSVEDAINNALDDNNLTVQYSEMLKLRKVINKAVADCIPVMKYAHSGTNYSVKLSDRAVRLRADSDDE